MAADSLPRTPPTEATNALSTFQIRSGFRIELAAAEPLVMDPIAMSFDEDGRLYVIEMRRAAPHAAWARSAPGRYEWGRDVRSKHNLCGGLALADSGDLL
jgi:hypothetical protein